MYENACVPISLTCTHAQYLNKKILIRATSMVIKVKLALIIGVAFIIQHLPGRCTYSHMCIYAKMHTCTNTCILVNTHAHLSSCTPILCTGPLKSCRNKSISFLSPPPPSLSLCLSLSLSLRCHPCAHTQTNARSNIEPRVVNCLWTYMDAPIKHSVLFL